MDPWLRSHFTQACTLNLHIICLELAEFPSRGSVDMTLAVVWTWTLLWSMSCSENSSCEADDLFAVLQVDATAGTVDSLYTFGAPGTASPGLTHSTTKDGCFPGARVTTQRTKGTGTWTDPITWVTNAVWLWNPKVDLYILDVDDPSKDQIVSCKTPDVQQMPRAPGSWRLGAWTRDMINAMELHTGKVFNEVTSRSSNKMLQSLSKFAVDLSYERDPKVAAQMAKSAGWRVVGAAMYEAGTSDTWVWSFGTQVSYLVQNPRSRDCIVTFQGTNDNVDNLQNIRGGTRPFCGLTLETDRCRPSTGNLPSHQSGRLLCAFRICSGARAHDPASFLAEECPGKASLLRACLSLRAFSWWGHVWFVHRLHHQKASGRILRPRRLCLHVVDQTASANASWEPHLWCRRVKTPMHPYTKRRLAGTQIWAL